MISLLLLACTNGKDAVSDSVVEVSSPCNDGEWPSGSADDWELVEQGDDADAGLANALAEGRGLLFGPGVHQGVSLTVQSSIHIAGCGVEQTQLVAPDDTSSVIWAVGAEELTIEALHLSGGKM